MFCAGVLTGCLASITLVACTTFFDGVESKRTPTRRLRRDLLQEIEALKGKLAEARRALEARQEAKPSEAPPVPAENAKTWPELAKLLPKDIAGQEDWVEALKAGVIAPRTGLDPMAPERQVETINIDLASSTSKVFTVTFPHEPHTRWIACSSCHPSIFPLRRTAEPTVVTMAKIREGRYCGTCHGRVAFDIKGECARCHARIPTKLEWRPSEEPKRPIEQAKTWAEIERLLPATGGNPDWAKALAEGVIAPRVGIDPKATEQPVFPLDVELVPTDNPIFRVIFPHGPHTKLLACTNCHPGVFQMARGADPITMAKIYQGEYCGRCHGKVAFEVPTGCPRCHPVLRGP